LVDVPGRTLRRWVQAGLLAPLRDHQGPDRWVATWRAKDLEDARIVRRLIQERGLPIKFVGELMTEVRQGKDGAAERLQGILGPAEDAPHTETRQTRLEEQVRMVL
jgi:DNA-binding transcriptional MerR regulator